MLVLPLCHQCLYPDRLPRNSIQHQILALVHPSLAMIRLALQDICSTKDRAPSKMFRVNGDDPNFFTGVLLLKVARNLLGMSEIIVHADKGRRYVGLMVQMSETKASEWGGAAENC